MPASLMLLWLMCLISLVSVDYVGASSEADALMQLKQGFGNPIKLSSWNKTINGSPCRNWRGVTCANNSTSVIKLFLPGLNFTGGTISSSIGDFPDLQYIDLSNNGLIGHIPAQLNSLPSLLYLDLSHNALTGNLPQLWSNLTKLAILTLTGNLLTGSIPIGLTEANSLMRLRLENNRLSGSIPPAILDNSLLHQLRYFAVESNNISGPIPTAIGMCISLRSFYAANNNLTGIIPESIGNLTHLLHFEVENNGLSGPLPDSMGNLNDSLTSLNVSNNGLIGLIPARLSRFNASSFVGNPSLCGYPLSNRCFYIPSTAPPPSYTRRESPNGVYYPSYNRKSSSKQTVKITAGVIGGIAGVFFLLLLFVVLSRKLKRDKTRDSALVQNWFSPDIQANRRNGRYEVFYRGFEYTYEEIVSNAGYFDTAHVIGKGRFATVYRSLLPDGTHMAVKVFRFANVPPNFEKEIEMLASIKHKNLLSIKGFYANPVEKAVFYDYLPTGTLYNLLHSQDNTPEALPDWPVRHNIALGVAQAMAYLHRGCGYKILHRDLKSTNILLEADLDPRVSDHGLVHMVSGAPGGAGDVVETPGYTAPEVLTSKKYTEKSDVYSYGVVLLELITGKKAVSYVRERSMNLTSWVKRLHGERRAREVIDPIALQTCPLPEYLDKSLELAVLCVDAEPNNRPTMAEIASVLEGFCSSSSPYRSPGVRLDIPLLPS